jgi:hypothetical protein
VNRRAAIAAVVTVTLLFFLIRVAIVFLSKEVVPGASTEIGDRSRGGPSAPPSREDTKRQAQGHLLALAVEAREAKDPKSATAAYSAEEALRRDDCTGVKTNLTKVGDSLPKDHRARGALESAQRSADAYCAMLTD